MELRDYQRQIATDANELLKQYKLCYLSMQVRTGKTATALHAAYLHGACKVLFVTKLKAISSIEQDYKNLKYAYSLTTINFESLHNITDEFDLIIIDEAHSLCAFPLPSERTKILKRICEGKPIIYLSGTPSPESYSQLYHQFYVSSYSPFVEYKSFYKWANDFVFKKIKYIYNRQLNDYSNANKAKIDELTKHLFISWTQEEAGFKQDVQEEVLYVKMKPSTYWLADKLIKDRVHITKDGGDIVCDTEVKLQNKLHQVYSGSIITEQGEAICFDHSKAEFIREHFNGHKIAVFYIFKAEYAMLLWAFGYDRLTTEPEEFNNSTDKVFVSQIQSGSMGVNLSTADTLIFFNIHFSNVQYWQARARIQTQARTKAAHIAWVFAERGIEDKIYQAVKNKHDYVLSYFRKDFKVKKEAIK
jgi:hypothetical protein